MGPQLLANGQATKRVYERGEVNADLPGQRIKPAGSTPGPGEYTVSGGDSSQ